MDVDYPSESARLSSPDTVFNTPADSSATLSPTYSHAPSPTGFGGLAGTASVKLEPDDSDERMAGVRAEDPAPFWPWKCDYPGCVSRFPTSQHLQRHKEIHPVQANSFPPVPENFAQVFEEECQKSAFTCGGTLPVIIEPNRTHDGSLTPRTGGEVQEQRALVKPVTIRWGSDGQGRMISFPHAGPSDIFDSLIQECAPATFGRGGKDIYDESYRRAGALDPSNFSTNFCPYEAGIVDVATQILLPGFKPGTPSGVNADIEMDIDNNLESSYRAQRNIASGKELAPPEKALERMKEVFRKYTSSLEVTATYEGIPSSRPMTVSALPANMLDTCLKDLGVPLGSSEDKGRFGNLYTSGRDGRLILEADFLDFAAHMMNAERIMRAKIAESA